MNSYVAKYIGATSIFLESVDSTNSYAQELIAKNNPSEGTAITTGFQTHGRGQIGRIWLGDPDKNIYTSIILKPTFITPSEQFLLNMAVSVALNKFCSETLNEMTTIKWPNDIYIGNRKVCGTLIQCTLLGNSINYGIIGIGINVNQETFQRDLPNPTSFYIEKGQFFDLNILNQRLYNHLEYWYEKLKHGDIDLIRSTYKTSIYKLNEQTSFTAEGTFFNGEILGVGQQGRLIIKANGEIKTFNQHEIKMIVEQKQL